MTDPTPRESDLVFELPGRSVRVAAGPGESLLAAAATAGVHFNTACAAEGRCGQCGVLLLAGRFLSAEGAELAGAPDQPIHALACRLRLGPAGDGYAVRVPGHSLVQGGQRVVAEFGALRSWRLDPPVRQQRLELAPPSFDDPRADLERILAALAEQGWRGVDVAHSAVASAPRACRGGDYRVWALLMRDGERWRLADVAPEAQPIYALAIDVGTTTVVCSLVDLQSGAVVDSASSYNQQVRRCADVASRISYVRTPEQLFEMHELLLGQTLKPLANLLRDRHGLDDRQIVRVSVSGNTVMTHLALLADPVGLGAAPFAPAAAAPPAVPAAAFDLPCHMEALATFAPAVSAYVGGDAVNGLYVCGFDRIEQPSLLVDIGTNAEIVLGDRDRLWACSAPAGPAFEGSWIPAAMRAAEGAIERVTIDPESAALRYEVIGGGAPTGVCGSGLIDLTAQARRAGLLSPTGRFAPDAADRCDRVREIDLPDGRRELALLLAEREETDDQLEPIAIRERDIATLLQAKGVILAAIRIACKQAGVDPGDLARIYLAGGFARHVDVDNAVALGMLPAIAAERFQFVGNASLAGAVLAAVDVEAQRICADLAARPTVIDLNRDPEFQSLYAESMLLP